MSQIKEQIKELRQYASERKGEIADICSGAADTIEGLSEKLRASRYFETEIQKMQELEQAEIEKAYELGRMKQEPCEDAISRQAAKKALEDRFMELQKRHSMNRYETNFCLNTILELPPVIPQPKIGKWIINGIGYSETYSYKLNCSCSVCGYKAVFYDHISSINPCLKNANYVHKFCPDCGHRMIESQESEDR